MGTAHFTAATTVNEVVQTAAALSRVLGAYGIDTCCGGSLTLAEAADAQGLPLGTLLNALEVEIEARQRPQATEVRQTVPASVQPAAAPSPFAAARYTRFFVASLVFAISFGAGLGACLLASMTLPWNFLHGLSPDAVRTAHGYAQVFGFAALFIMGVAYHVIPRFNGVALAAPQLARASFWLQVCGVLAVALGALVGAPIAGPARLLGAAALLGAALAFGWNVHRTLRAGTAAPASYERYLHAGCAWLVVATAIAVTVAAGGGLSLQAAAWEAALWGFAASWLFGMSLRILPVFLGVRPARGPAEDFLFVGYQIAVGAWVAVAVVEAWTFVPAARAVAGFALAVTAASLVLRLGVLGPRERGEADDAGYAKFIVTAYAWLLAALIFAPGWSAGAALSGTGAPSLLVDFGRHAFTLGFLTQMIIGVATRIVPVFTGARLWSRTWQNVTYYLLNAAVAARGLQVVVELAESAAVWPYISISGAFGLAAFVAFTVNVIMTVRSRPVATAGPAAEPARDEPSADHLVADLLKIPGALELLVQSGFRPLANPAMRAAMAGTVTLRQAGRIHNIDVEPLIAELRRLAAAKHAA